MKQEERWATNWGDDYVERNKCSVNDLETEYLDLYGIGRSEVNRRLFGDLGRVSVLEVGCGHGVQLLTLREQFGLSDLQGIDVNQRSLDYCHKAIKTTRASGWELPFPDNTFDVVMTNGVLIHIPPRKLKKVMSEMLRVSKKWIVGLEYYAEEMEEIKYRGEDQMMWRGPYPEKFVELGARLEKREVLARSDGKMDVIYRLVKP